MRPRTSSFILALALPLVVLAAIALSGPALGATPHDPEPEVGVLTVSLPAAVASFGGAIESGYLYVLGGHTGRAHRHSKRNLWKGFARLDLGGDGTWETLPGPVAHQSVALVAHGGRLYRIGGMAALNDPGEPEDLHSSAEFAAFDPATRAWTELPPLPAARSSHDAVVSGNRIYVVGGWSIDGEAKTWHEDMLVCDLSESPPRWTAVRQPFRRRALAAGAMNGKIYAIGGITADGDTSRRVDVYDPSSGGWSAGPELPAMGFGASAMGVDDGLFVSLMNGSILRLDEASPSWQPVGRLAFPRFFHRLLATESGTLAFVGGAHRIGHLRSIEWWAPSRSGTPHVAHMRVPNPGSAKNRQGLLLDKGDLYVFGGNDSLGQHDFDERNFLDEGFRLSLADLTTKPAARLPVKRQSLRSVHDGGWLLGGFGHGGGGDKAHSHDEVLAYRFGDDAWEKTPWRLPAPLTQFGVTRWQEKTWIFGGLDYDPQRGQEAFSHSDRIYVSKDGAFEPSEHRLPEPRRAFGGARIGDRYYIAGGMKDGFELVPDFIAFDFATETWEELPAPRPRISPQLVAVEGRLYLAGGSSPKAAGKGFEPNPTLEMFDPTTKQWSVVMEQLPVTPRHVRMLPFQGRLLLFSAHNDEGVIDLAVIVPPKG